MPTRSLKRLSFGDLRHRRHSVRRVGHAIDLISLRSTTADRIGDAAERELKFTIDAVHPRLAGLKTHMRGRTLPVAPMSFFKRTLPSESLSQTVERTGAPQLSPRVSCRIEVGRQLVMQAGNATSHTQDPALALGARIAMALLRALV